MKQLLLLLSIAFGAADMEAAQRVLQFAKKVPWFGIGAAAASYKGHKLFAFNESKLDGRNNIEILSNNPIISENGKFIFCTSKGTDDDGNKVIGTYINKKGQERFFIEIEEETFNGLELLLNPKRLDEENFLKNNSLEEIAFFINKALFALGHEKAHCNLGHVGQKFSNEQYSIATLKPIFTAGFWYLFRLRMGIIPSLIATGLAILPIDNRLTFFKACQRMEKAADLNASIDYRIVMAGAEEYYNYAAYLNKNKISTTSFFGITDILTSDPLHPHPLERARYLLELAKQLKAEQQKNK